MMLHNRTWLLIGRKMADEASPQELKELEEILKNNPELHFSLQALTEIWQQSPAENLSETQSAYQQHLNRLKAELTDHPGSNYDMGDNSPIFSTPRPSFFRRKGFMAAMLVTAVLLTVAGVFYSTPSTVETEKISSLPVASEVSTRYGSKSNIVLPDGTRVSLNAGSKLTYDKNFGEKVRGVKLTGEAYFDVVHNAEKPFVIHTTAMEIKVLGTEFNVKSYPDESTTEASLIRGSIEVTLKDKRAEKIIMKPNEKLVVSNDIADLQPSTVVKSHKPVQSAPLINLGHVNYFSLDSTILETSWVSNRLVFEDESFEQVATRMSRWYGVEFEFEDTRIQNLRFTGNFRNETVEEALKAMQITADFSYRIRADKHIIITKN